MHFSFARRVKELSPVIALLYFTEAKSGGEFKLVDE
jgi:hypothetical protein